MNTHINKCAAKSVSTSYVTNHSHVIFIMSSWKRNPFLEFFALPATVSQTPPSSFEHGIKEKGGGKSSFVLGTTGSTMQWK